MTTLEQGVLAEKTAHPTGAVSKGKANGEVSTPSSGAGAWGVCNRGREYNGAMGRRNGVEKACEQV